jgi:hypothetical protein
MRDVEGWEGDWLNYRYERRQAGAKQYPQALLDQFTASSTVMEKGSGGGGGGDGASAAGGDDSGAAAAGKKKGGSKKDAAAAAAAAGGAAGDAAGGDATGDDAAAESKAAAAPPPSTGGAGGLDSFYERGGSAATDESKKGGLVIAPRVTAADSIGDTRSLDRAYSQRLVLLVRDKATGGWGAPAGLRLPGEPMAQAAERAVRALFGGPAVCGALDLWYVGAAPVGHWLQVHPPEVQAATGTYGSKTFFYRAEILNGRFALPRGEPGDGRDAASFPYDDFHWLARDEAEGVLPRPLYKYLHQVIGAGPGEEFARRTKWLAGVERRGLTVDQASGRRAYRVAVARRPGGYATAGAPRLPAVATQAQAALAAAPFAPGGGGGKAAALAGELNAYHDRLRAQRGISAGLRTALATPPASVLAAQVDAAKRAKEAASSAHDRTPRREREHTEGERGVACAVKARGRPPPTPLL